MIGKKINQLATELAPVSTDLTIIGDPISGVSKKITLAQLGAIFSGAVSFYTDLASFPATGDINVIYCAKDTQKLYLWSGSAYVEVFPSQALLDTYQLRSEKGNANGYASLDSGGKVPISQLPSSIMEYKGTWSASTNTPTLANGTGDTGDVYICNVAGTVNFGAGAIAFAVGDYVIYSGTIWQRSSGAVGTVTSVALTVGGDAISVSGSPLTTSGTLGLTFNGTTAQYIRGNGTLETFPTSLISGTGNVNAIPKFTANTVLGNSVMEDDGNFVSMRGLKLNLIAGTGNSINFQQASGIIAAGLGYSSIGAASSTGIKFYLDQNVTTRSFVLDTTTITSDTERTYSMPNSSGTLALTSDIPSLTGYVPYTGATTNLDLGSYDLTTDIINLNQLKAVGSGGLNIYSNSGTHIALMGGGGGAGTTFYGGIIGTTGSFTSSGSSDTFGITHSSGSGIALNITKGGNGEGLYINKTSGSGNAATIIGTLNATTLVKSGGTSSQFLKADGSVDSTSYGTGSVTSVGLSSATSGVTIGSTPITTSGTITLAIATASGSQQGLLSSTDWTTFNNKQNALTNPVTGTGTTNYLPKFTGASTIGNSLVYDNGTTVFVNATTAPALGSPKFLVKMATTNTYEGILVASSSNNNVIAIAHTGSLGLITTNYGTSGATTPLAFGTEGIAQMTLSTSGNLGLGVTPNAWTDYKVLQFGGGSVSSYTDNRYFEVNQNSFWDGSYKYVNTGFSSRYMQYLGMHQWYTAPSGTAGNAISFTQAMTLNASGNLSIGNTNDTYKLDVNGTGIFRNNLNVTVGGLTTTFTGNDITFSRAGATYITATGAGSSLYIGTNNVTDRLVIASTGAATFSSSVQTGGNIRTLMTGTTDVPSIYAENNVGSLAQIRVFGTSAGGTLFGVTRAGWSSMDTNNGLGLLFGTTDTAPIVIGTSNTERMRITSGGLVGIGTSSPAERLTVAGGNFRLNGVNANSRFIIYQDYSSSAVGVQLFNNSGVSVIDLNGNAGNINITGSISTGAPTGGTAGSWKLGTATSGVALQGGTIRVEVNGVAYDLLTT
jgi:hypothetical protein